MVYTSVPIILNDTILRKVSLLHKGCGWGGSEARNGENNEMGLNFKRLEENENEGETMMMQMVDEWTKTKRERLTSKDGDGSERREKSFIHGRGNM